MSKNKYNNYKNYWDKETEEPAENTAVENETVEAVEEAVPATVGVVYKCEKLNLRKKPTKDSDILTVVTADTELEIIDIDKSSGKDWYKVQTEDGLIGFCMKNYIIIK